MAKKDKSEYIIQSVSHALDLLEEFQGDADELGVTELSKRLKLHKNNVFRLLATLESRGYIEQNKATENYRLGLKSLELGQTFIRQMGLLRQARPVMESLVEACNETTYVGIVRENYVVYLDVVEAKQTVRVVNRVGARLPVYCTAMGKAQLAYESEDEIERLLPAKELKRYTENTITELPKLLEHLRKVAEQGYAVDDREFEPDVKCVAVPIRDYTRRVVGGISVSAPAIRLPQERIERELAPLVKKAGAEISARLGYEIGLGAAG
ncbi:MAG TPA: IclR family transcriptional regulator [Thermodesulfobacteriota bacterium]|nr:IclR family transcriptional regulator [Thermodesulfobacteriota bacterium]